MCVLVSQSCPAVVTPWTGARQAPLFLEFSWQEYWSGLPFHSPGDLPKLGIKPGSPTLQADCLPFELPRKPHELWNSRKILLIVSLVYALHPYLCYIYLIFGKQTDSQFLLFVTLKTFFPEITHSPKKSILKLALAMKKIFKFLTV